MMKEDLREVFPLWSLDRRGDAPRGPATTSETLGVLYAFGCTAPLGEPLDMVPDGLHDRRRIAPRRTVSPRWR